MSACGFANGAEVDSAPSDMAPSGGSGGQNILPGSMSGEGGGGSVRGSRTFGGTGMDSPSGVGADAAMGSRTPSGLMKLAGGRVGFAARTPTATSDGVAASGSYRRSVRRIDAI